MLLPLTCTPLSTHPTATPAFTLPIYLVSKSTTSSEHPPAFLPAASLVAFISTKPSTSCYHVLLRWLVSSQQTPVLQPSIPSVHTPLTLPPLIKTLPPTNSPLHRHTHTSREPRYSIAGVKKPFNRSPSLPKQLPPASLPTIPSSFLVTFYSTRPLSSRNSKANSFNSHQRS